MANKIRNLILSSTPARLLYGWKEIRNHISHFNRDLIFCKIYLLYFGPRAFIFFILKQSHPFEVLGIQKLMLDLYLM